MPDPYKNIPNVLPGSQAAQAVDEIGQLVQSNNLSPDALEQAIKQKIIEYGGDPVTAAAASRTASVLAEQDPARSSMIAENIVGATLADPGLASSQASDRVDARLKEMGVDPASLSDDQKKTIAYEEANAVLTNAGAANTESSQALQQAVDQYIEQGASPSQAAAAAVVSVLAQAMPKSDSFSIFGYLSMLVHGEVEYTFKSTEKMTVTDTSIHTHLSNTKFDMPGHKFYIKATDIKTSGTNEWVRAHPGAAFGFYDGDYLSATPASGSLFLWSNQYGVEQLAVGLISASASTARVYLSFYDSDMVVNKWGISKVKTDNRMTLIEACNFVRERYSSKSTFIK